MWYEELTHWKRPWCWERLRVGEGDDRGWDGWMASPTWWTWVWVSSGRWWWAGRPSVLQSMGSQRVGHDWVTELNWTDEKCPWKVSSFTSRGQAKIAWITVCNLGIENWWVWGTWWGRTALCRRAWQGQYRSPPPLSATGPSIASGEWLLG